MRHSRSPRKARRSATGSLVGSCFLAAALAATALSPPASLAATQGQAPETTVATAALAPEMERASARAWSDFNADGWSDLAVAKTNANGTAGRVYVVYGSSGGLLNTPDQTFSQGVGLPGSAEAGDNLGEALAWGDFNGDGRDDLALGAPYDAYGSLHPGSVTVIYGSNAGLAPATARMFSPDTPKVVGTAQDYEAFGRTLAVGDFGWGPQDDLAIASPSKTMGGVALSGSFTVLYGSPGGIKGKHSRTFSIATQGVKGNPTDNGFMGRDSMAAGNFGRTRYDDLAIGAAESFAGLDRSGAVHVFYGSQAGITVQGNQRFVQGAGSVPDQAEDLDFFASSVAAGNFGKTKEADLAVGALGEDMTNPTINSAGSVFVLYGSADGLTGVGSRQLWQGGNGIPGPPAASNHFGAMMTAGNLGKTAQADLVVGVPDADPGGIAIVVYGGRRGIKPKTSQQWDQDSPGILNTAEAGDYLGNALAIGNYGSGAVNDLAIGVHSEDMPGFANAGAINVIFGSSTGLTSSGNQFLYEGANGFPGALEASGFLPDALA